MKLEKLRSSLWAIKGHKQLNCLSTVNQSLLFQAERYQALVDELLHNRLLLSLAELYRNEKGIDAVTNTLREKKQAAAAATSKLEDGEQTMKSFKKEHGRFTREQLHIEKEMRCVSVYFSFNGLTKGEQRV